MDRTLLGTAVHQRLTHLPTGDLAEIVYCAITQVADEGNLTPGHGPSTTLITRWTTTQVDTFVVGDGPIVVATTDNQLHEVRDDRLDQIPGPKHRSVPFGCASRERRETAPASPSTSCLAGRA